MISSGGSNATGVSGRANGGSTDNIGVQGYLGSTPGSGATAVNAGVVGRGSSSGNGNINAGVAGYITSNGASIDAAIYGDDGGQGAPTWAGYFNGRAFSLSGGWSGSDLRFKKDLIPLTDVQERISQLTGYSYTYKKSEFKGRYNFDDRRTIGLIAQELKEVFPELVDIDSRGYYMVNYQGMIPVLLEAIKAQQKQIDAQNKAIEAILKRTESVINGNIEDFSLNNLTIEQNEPNPFSYETIIRFNIPTSTNSVYIVIYDLSGKQISSKSITERGAASVLFTADNIPAGIYLYTIVADGKFSETKRMIISTK